MRVLHLKLCAFGQILTGTAAILGGKEGVSTPRHPRTNALLFSLPVLLRWSVPLLPTNSRHEFLGPPARRGPRHHAAMRIYTALLMPLISSVGAVRKSRCFTLTRDGSACALPLRASARIRSTYY
jgi:hypothetical protein